MLPWRRSCTCRQTRLAANSVGRSNIVRRTIRRFAKTFPPSPFCSLGIQFNFAAASRRGDLANSRCNNCNAYYFLLPLPTSTQYPPKDKLATAQPN